MPMFVICGTKADLTGRRTVDSGEAKKFAQRKKARYYEVSAKENTGITEMFSEIASICTGK